MELRIRPASRPNRDSLLAFHHALYVDHHRTLVPEPLRPLGAYRDLETALRDDVDHLLSGRGAIVLLGELADGPVGYITGRVENEPRRVLNPRGIIEDWFVDESVRGRGFGRALLEALLSEFRRKRCQVAESTTWPTNKDAVAAHRAAGFVEVEVRLRRRL